MGWLRLVGSLKLQVSFAEYSLFYRALLKKRPIILRSLLIIATPQCGAVCCSVLQCAAVRCSVYQCVAMCCSVLQCVAVCCSVLQCTIPLDFCSTPSIILQCPTKSATFTCEGSCKIFLSTSSFMSQSIVRSEVQIHEVRIYQHIFKRYENVMFSESNLRSHDGLAEVRTYEVRIYQHIFKRYENVMFSMSQSIVRSEVRTLR